VGADYVAREHWNNRPRNNKRLVIQPNKVVLGSHRPSSGEGPLDAKARCPTGIGAAGGGRKRNAADSNRGIARPNPSATSFGIHEYTVPCITKAAGHGRQPSIVDSNRDRDITRSNPADSVVRIRKPIEVRFDADDGAAQELIVRTDLATTYELGGAGVRESVTNKSIGNADVAPPQLRGCRRYRSQTSCKVVEAPS
jgi:hypothetical protein